MIWLLALGWLACGYIASRMAISDLYWSFPDLNKWEGGSNRYKRLAENPVWIIYIVCGVISLIIIGIGTGFAAPMFKDPNKG